jgi:CheY-like chemotaxis protein
VEQCGEVMGLEDRRVLVVDDEPVVLNLVRDMLARLGCEVVMAESPFEAIELGAASEFDLLVTDLVMPEVDGVRVACALAERRPGLCVVFMSADVSGPGLADGHPLAAAPFLHKPFSLDQLTAALREALGV